MPAKRQTTRYDFNILAEAEALIAGRDKLDPDDGNDPRSLRVSPRSLRVSEAPTNSKFYENAETYGPQGDQS
jgi:hypothetical protein